MGTNYYLETSCPNPCDHCVPPRQHIGKASAGWRFLASADGMDTWSWSELRERLENLDGSVVIDEYDERVNDLIERIEASAYLGSHLDLELPPYTMPSKTVADGPVDFTEGGFS